MPELRKKPTAADWTKGVVAALVLYILLLGPVDGLQSAGRLPEPLATTARWLYAPLAWFIAYAPEPIHKAFYWYVRFWVELLKDGGHAQHDANVTRRSSLHPAGCHAQHDLLVRLSPNVRHMGQVPNQPARYLPCRSG